MELQQTIGFLKTPALWDSELLEVTQFNFPEIDISNFIPKQIPNNLRLGHQIEHIFHQLITQQNEYEVLLFNEPIRNENRTLGELDFIIKNTKTNIYYHIELTYKFYLIDFSNTDPIHQLIGPNKKDSFYQKLTKIKEKQFKLLHSIEACKLLIKNNLNNLLINSQTCFKAQLFIPYFNKEKPIIPFKKESIFGYWISYTNFKHDTFFAHKFYIPTKKEWVVKPHENVAYKTQQNIHSEIEEMINRKRSPMVWLKSENNDYSKLFIVWW
ncbi:DUF1853 family protein [Cellulophaga baltica]|uniref:DUF1853 family protein n=1 Tax=Cellulophaga TaxID=104264 RepID=UPI001C078CC3|nr:MULTISPECIES: DUF1853 family protein [Cellulophaga]MBU2996218.1 DUF1853 family protein [Cellulophaga baltica]MDO6767613.1 DUF1853 family protein [Cellulophaga sp. 1_MG-2023]